MKNVLAACLLLISSPTSGALTPTEVIAVTILGEARGEGKEGMYAVACVIAQRSIERKKSASDVCLQKWQFSCWNENDPNRSKLPTLLHIPQAVYALHLARNIDKLDHSYVNYANHYHVRGLHVYWSKNEKAVATIGKHRFFKL